MAKVISDLDALVGALLTTLPSTRPWQRMLLDLLDAVDREVEVLRMTIVLERPDLEIAAAALQVHDTLALVHVRTIKIRADADNKAAVVLALGLAKLIRDGCLAPLSGRSRLATSLR